MTGLSLGLIALALTMGLLVFRVHIGITMMFGGAACFLAVNSGDLTGLLFTLNNLVYSRLSNYDLVVVPLFVLMGQFATQGGLSRALFQCAAAFIGHRKGGIGMSAIGACAGFSAICGSSLATAATMSQVALPELRRHHYSSRLATGSIAAGGTLGVLLPPSVPLIIYAVLTQESIASLFVAAIIPGLLAVVGYLIVMRIMVQREGGHDHEQPKASRAERLRAFISVTPVIAVFLVVILGLYTGWANPTEAASIGAAACGLLAIIQGGMRWQGMRASLIGTAETTAMIFLVLLGADLLNTGLALTQLPNELANWVQNSGLSPFVVLIAILILYLLLGIVMDSLAMILLTIPIFYPMIMGLDLFGLSPADKSIWFGILALMVVEIGLVTPPIGMNLLIVQRAAKDVPLMEIARGIVPFLLSDLVRLVLLIAFPGICLWLLY